MKRVTVRKPIVHRTFAAVPSKTSIFAKVWLKYLLLPVPCSGTAQIHAHDWGTPPMKHSVPHSSHCTDCAGTALRLPRNAGRAMIWLYRHTLSPLVGYNCRHLPTCSVYGDEAIERFGLWAGGWMTLARLLRCQPWGTSGLDFVPDALPAGARSQLPRGDRPKRGLDPPPRAPPAAPLLRPGLNRGPRLRNPPPAHSA